MLASYAFAIQFKIGILLCVCFVFIRRPGHYDFILKRKDTVVGQCDIWMWLWQIQLVIGPDTGISVGWQRHDKKTVGTGDLKVCLVQVCSRSLGIAVICVTLCPQWQCNIVEWVGQIYYSSGSLFTSLLIWTCSWIQCLLLKSDEITTRMVMVH